VCQIVASSANLQWSAVMLLNISLMKMLKRMGEITEPKPSAKIQQKPQNTGLDS
jgi:hypothetical protein